MTPSINAYRPAHSPSGDLPGMHQRYELFQRHDEDKAKFVAELMAENERMIRQSQALVIERNQYRAWAESMQTERNQYDMLLTHAQRIMDTDPIVVVLLDADAMIFLDEFLRDGESGGHRAASLLYATVHSYLENECADITAQVNIVCRIYANVRGLAEALVRAGSIQEAGQFQDFVRGFTAGETLCDFVDVGQGKVRAADKMTRLFKLYDQNFHCRRILFGCSHDDECVTTLKECSDRVETVKKVVLLEGPLFEKDLVPLPYRTKKFPKLFRDKKLSGTVFGAPSPTARVFVPGATGLPARFPPPAAVRPSGTLTNSPLPHRAPMASLPGTSSCSTTTSDDLSTPKPTKPTTTTWASKAAAPAPPQAPPVQPVKMVKESEALFARNRVGQRVDPYCKDYDKTEVDRIKRMKLCNVHFLRAECPYDKQCTHIHNYELTADETETLRLVARMAPCVYGSGCADPRCIYGHRCQAPRSKTHHAKDTKSCIFGETCKFPPELHDIDTEIVKLLVVR